MGRKHLAGDLLRHFESEAEQPWHLREKFAPEFFAGKLVEGEIAADGREGFGVFAEALGFEELAREAAAREIAPARIDLPEPSFIFPRAAANANILISKSAQLAGQRGAVEIAGFVEERTYHACMAR